MECEDTAGGEVAFACASVASEEVEASGVGNTPRVRDRVS